MSEHAFSMEYAEEERYNFECYESIDNALRRGEWSSNNAPSIQIPSSVDKANHYLGVSKLSVSRVPTPYLSVLLVMLGAQRSSSK